MRKTGIRPGRFGAAFHCAAFVLTLASTLGAASFTAALDRDTISLGERATLTLRFEGGTPAQLPMPAAVPDLQIHYGRSPSSFTANLNGQSFAVYTDSFIIIPQQAGEFTLPALSAQVGQETLTTQPLKLKVLPAGSQPAGAVTNSPPVFARLVLPKSEAYLGEVLTAELQLYRRRDLPYAARPNLASFLTEGFTVGRMATLGERAVQVGNSVYAMLVATVALTPVKTGPLSVGPATLNVTIEVPAASGRDPMAERLQQLGIRVPSMTMSEARDFQPATEKVAVQVNALPQENVPPSFAGAVGNFSVSVSSGPTNVAVGDPITVRVQVSGRGALDALALPEQDWTGFKAYPPSAQLDTSDALGIEGTKTFEQIVMPQNTDLKELPPVSFTFFDPDQKSYRTVTSSATPLHVRSGGPAAFAGLGVPSNEDQRTEDIISIKQRIGTVAQTAPPLLEQPWFLALQSVPVLAFVSAVVWRQRNDTFASNPRLRRQRHVAQLVRDGLTDLRKFAAENDSDAFFATVLRLLQERLGERLEVPASAITEAVVEEQLRPRRVAEQTLAELRELFQTCNLARYAPIKTSRELAALIPKIESVLRQIQEVKL